MVISTDGDIHKWWYPQMVISTDGDIHRLWYPQMVIFTDGDIHRCWYPQMVLFTDGDIHRWCYPQMVISTDGDIHRWCYPQMVISTDGIIHKWWYPQMVLSTNGDIHRWCYPQMVISQGWTYNLLSPISSLLQWSPFQICVIFNSSTVMEYRPWETNYFPPTQEFPAFYETLWPIIFSERSSRSFLRWVRRIQPHIPSQCYSPGYTWPSKRSPSFRLTHPNPVFISLLSYECHMAKPYHPWLNYHNIWKVIKTVKFLAWSFPQPSPMACSLGSHYFPSTLSSSILTLFYSLKWETNFHAL